jgi:hypothetical protein
MISAREFSRAKGRVVMVAVRQRSDLVTIRLR